MRTPTATEKITFTKEESSNIASGEYNPEKQVLFLNFHSGGRYLYYKVPLSTWEGLKNASSKGSFFHTNIRSVYKYERIY